MMHFRQQTPLSTQWTICKLRTQLPQFPFMGHLINTKQYSNSDFIFTVVLRRQLRVSSFYKWGNDLKKKVVCLAQAVWDKSITVFSTISNRNSLLKTAPPCLFQVIMYQEAWLFKVQTFHSFASNVTLWIRNIK